MLHLPRIVWPVQLGKFVAVVALNPVRLSAMLDIIALRESKISHWPSICAMLVMNVRLAQPIKLSVNLVFINPKKEKVLVLLALQ